MVGHDLSGPSANQGRDFDFDPDPDFDFDRSNDRTDRSPFVLLLVLAVSSCTCTCTFTASRCTCSFLGRAGGRPKRYPLSHAFPSGSGKPPAEGAVAFSTGLSGQG
ncbi:MAG: hypothetical protein PHF14_05000 [Verrucomicrobiota bacterium]|nr:hypothetical protein [Verrucomicrobiota bacterium]